MLGALDSNGCVVAGKLEKPMPLIDAESQPSGDSGGRLFGGRRTALLFHAGVVSVGLPDQGRYFFLASQSTGVPTRALEKFHLFRLQGLAASTQKVGYQSYQTAAVKSCRSINIDLFEVKGQSEAHGQPFQFVGVGSDRVAEQFGDLDEESLESGRGNDFQGTNDSAPEFQAACRVPAWLGKHHPGGRSDPSSPSSVPRVLAVTNEYSSSRSCVCGSIDDLGAIGCSTTEKGHK